MAGPTKRRTNRRTKEELLSELKRIEGLLERSFSRIDDPAVSLSQRLRLNLGRVELEAYAKGLRYAIGTAADEVAAFQSFPNLGRRVERESVQVG
jgi:hypothetical protein